MACNLAIWVMLLLPCMALAESNEIGPGIWGAQPRWAPLPRDNVQKIDGLGVNYGTQADNLPPPEQVRELVQSTSISSIKLYLPDPGILQAFANTGVSLVVGVADEDIPVLAASEEAAAAWVESHISPFHPATNIIALAVGNEVVTSKISSSYNLLPAMQNLYGALQSRGMVPAISVSTTHSMAVLATSYPPSESTFQVEMLPLLRPLLNFLSQTSSPFMANAYPYFAYRQNADVISLDYALFRPNPGVTDPNTGLHYTNLLDAQVDAIYFAMKAAGFQNIPVVVAETGWPSGGDSNELGATMANAQQYNANVIKHVSSRAGTPYKPHYVIPTYIFALFNENLKPGATSERNFGLYHTDGTSVYDVGLELRPSTSTVLPPRPATPFSNNEKHSTWCIAKPSAPDAKLEQSIQYACGEGGADCQPIQEGGTCFSPNTLAAHASFAMNSYFQRNGRNAWNCDFDGEGILTATDPSYGSCTYPSE